MDTQPFVVNTYSTNPFSPYLPPFYTCVHCDNIRWFLRLSFDLTIPPDVTCYPMNLRTRFKTSGFIQSPRVTKNSPLSKAKTLTSHVRVALNVALSLVSVYENG